MNWTQIFLKLFGVTELFGISLGFWIAMGICLLVVVGNEARRSDEKAGKIICMTSV